MRLIFIRHGDPDYSIDSLTTKGFREAGLLSDRITQLEVRNFYCSPLGRAQDTAKVSIKNTGRTFETLDWLTEFTVEIDDPDTKKKRIVPWDLMPAYWTAVPELYDKDHWLDSEIMKSGPVREKHRKVISSIDHLLAEHGYIRSGNIYKTEKSNTDTLVFFCHLGVQFVLLSHLLGISPSVLWQGFFVAPSSVTELRTEERIKGEAYFRCTMLGDTSHLYIAGEPKSFSGFYKEVY